MSAPKPPPSAVSYPGRFQAGGTLREGALYVERSADRELAEALLRGEFCYVLSPRQIGKSSLRVRTSQRLQADGIRCVTIDLTTIGSKNSTASEWYFGFLRVVAEQLHLTDPEPFWNEKRLLSPVHRFSLYLRDHVIFAQLGKVVIFIDEVDALLSLTDVSRDDFFGAVRALYNARADDSRYELLTFCLIGVAMATDLIQDEKRTPFNVGRGISLTDFTSQEIDAFLPGLEKPPLDGRKILEEVYKWTSGHPYMTQMICQAICEEDLPPQLSETDLVTQIVTQIFLRKGRVLEPSLSYAEKWFDRTDNPTRTAAMLRLYGRLRQGERVRSRSDDAVQVALRLTGMAGERQEEGTGTTYLEVRNRIYADVFDATWVRDQMAKRLIASPMLRWQESGKREEFLLSGRALVDAKGWANETADLTHEERLFLDSSERSVQRGRAQRMNILFLTEIWKSAANYLLLFILVSYMSRVLEIEEKRAKQLYRWYFTAIYLSPLVGGYLADRVIGHRRSVFFGILILALGYFVMTIPHIAALIAGFVILFVGHGLYKPNFAALVGGIYPKEDPRRDTAFIRYYLGLNLGAALGPILVTALAGYGSMSAAAGVAMVVALLSFQHYPDPPEQGPNWLEDPKRSGENLASQVLPGTGGESRPISGLVRAARAAARDNDRRRFGAVVLMIGVVAIPFWLTFYAAGNLAEDWLSKRTQEWLSYAFSVSPTTSERLTAAQNPLFVVLMMPVMWAFVRLWRARHSEPTTAGKMTAGMVLLTLAMLVLMIPNPEKGSTMLLLIGYGVLSLAELCVVPIGYSLVTELAPRTMMATALGAWFIPMTVGQNLARELGEFWGRHGWSMRYYLLMLAGVSFVSAMMLYWKGGRVRQILRVT